LDNFKVYNDSYGFDKGDKVLLYTADCLKKLFGADKNNFIGHIGGDDFVVILQNEDFEAQLKNFITQFDSGIKQFYSPNDIRAGGITGKGRDEISRKYGFVSLSIGVVPSANQPFHSIFEISDVAVMVKKKAKAMAGSNYYVDKRSSDKNKDNKIKLSDIKILINEQQSYSLRIIKHLLEPFSFTLIDAGSKEEILNKFIKEEPTAVIIDIDTRQLIEIALNIRKHENNCGMKKSYILALCEQLSQEQVIELIKAGVDGILTIPVSKEALFSKIKDIIKIKN